MKNKAKQPSRDKIFRLAVVAIVWSVVAAAALWIPYNNSSAAASADAIPALYRRPAPNYDLNLSRNAQNLRQATGAQIQALSGLKTAVNAPNMTARWNDFGGSPDVMYDFASQSFPGTPEQAARAFIGQNASLFGVTDAGSLRVFTQRQALGGTLIRFQQTFNGID